MSAILESDTPEPAGSVPVLRALGRMLLVQPRWLAWVLPLAWATSILLLSSVSGPDAAPKPWELGGFTINLGHPAAFGILALLIVPLAPRREVPGLGRWTDLSPAGALWTVAIVGLYGFSDELHQSVVKGRDASLFDLLSDVVGAAAVVAVVMYLGRPDAAGRGLRRRLMAGLAASCAAAAISTVWGWFRGNGPWPF